MTFGASDGAYHKTSVIGPDGADASFGGPTRCYPKSAIPSQRRPIAYRGNGNYTVIVQTFSNNACTAGEKETRFLFSINGGTAVVAPAKKYLADAPEELVTGRSPTASASAVNPGTSAYEFQYLRNGVIGPDGGFTGPAEVTGTSSSAPYLDLTFQQPGRYVAVARGVTNRYFTPFSAPVIVHGQGALRPLLRAVPRLAPARATSSRARCVTSSPAATASRSTPRKRPQGRQVPQARPVLEDQLAPPFHAALPAGGHGNYRIQYRFKGSKLVTKGKVTDVVTIRHAYRF